MPAIGRSIAPYTQVSPNQMPVMWQPMAPYPQYQVAPMPIALGAMHPDPQVVTNHRPTRPSTPANSSTRARIGKQFWSLFKPVKMPVATSALVRITKQLMLANGLRQPFKICIINQPKYGAISFTKGMVMVNVGLLQQVKSPDELAFELARELSHVKHRHRRGKMKLVYASGLGGLISEVVLSRFEGIKRAIWWGLTLASEVLPAQLVAKVFRNYELEADLDAVRMLINAGYSPYGYATSIVNKENDASRLGKVFSMIEGNDYPTAATRKAALEQYLHTKQLPRYMPKPFMSPQEWQGIKQAAARYPTFAQKSFKKKARDIVWNGV